MQKDAGKRFREVNAVENMSGYYEIYEYGSETDHRGTKKWFERIVKDSELSVEEGRKGFY